MTLIVLSVVQLLSHNKNNFIDSIIITIVIIIIIIWLFYVTRSQVMTLTRPQTLFLLS